MKQLSFFWCLNLISVFFDPFSIKPFVSVVRKFLKFVENMKELLLLCNNYDFSYELYANLLIHENPFLGLQTKTTCSVIFYLQIV